VFEDFSGARQAVSSAEIAYRRRGSGPPLLLLHGWPQTHAIWHRVAPRLAQEFTVIASDLRGYGDSSKPEAGEDHGGYSKRATALDQVELMQALGFDSFAVVGHDRGGRVAHRMVRDHPERVSHIAVLDIVPTETVFSSIDKELATAYYHWFFLIQAADLPERLIGGDSDYYVEQTLERLSGPGFAFDTGAVEEYRRCFRSPATVHAACEDYRAAASIDLEHDAADSARVACPLLALWGEEGRIGRMFDVLQTWREFADDVSGRALPGGHFVPEEAPEETIEELLAFLSPASAQPTERAATG
jgi:haloacetate dehalogenase